MVLWRTRLCFWAFDLISVAQIWLSVELLRPQQQTLTAIVAGEVYPIDWMHAYWFV